MPDRPVGPVVDPLPSGLKPDLRVLPGRHVTLQPLNVEQHGVSLFEHVKGQDDVWTYLGYGPFATELEFLVWLKAQEASRDPWFYAFVSEAGGKAMGMGSVMRCDAANGVIEIGHIWMSHALQRTALSTESIYLMMKHCFEDLGVRRLEWKCNALNAASRRAADRFGFSFEGIFRQNMVVKGRNRDTAWYSIIDSEWTTIKAGFEAWLQPFNFAADGQQKAKLQVR